MSSLGSSQTTQSTNTGQTTGTYTPTQNQNVTDFRNNLYPQINSFLANANKPVYGNAQQAQFTNTQNQLFNSNNNQLASQLAARIGSVNSGAFALGVQNNLQNRAGALSGYAMQVPMLNQQARQANMGQALQIGNQIAGPALTSNTQSGTTQGQSQSTVTQNPSIMSDISGIAGIAGSVMGIPGVGSMFGLGGQGAGNLAMQNAYANPYPGSFAPTPGNVSGVPGMPGFSQDAYGYVQGMGGY